MKHGILKTKGRIFLLLIIFTLSGILAACGGKKEQEFDFHTEAQKAYLEGNYAGFTSYARGTEELGIPNPLLLEAKAKDGPYVFHISTDPEFKTEIVLNSDSRSCSLYNPLLYATYYYYAEAGEYRSGIKQVKIVSAAPRNMYIDGITNFRDLGGWDTDDGGKVRQGQIYRSSKFNADESADILITAEGMAEIKKLGIRTEIDLRTVSDNENGGLTASPLGEEVRYVSVPLESGGNIILLNKDKLKELFAVLGDEANYPIVFHCSIGTDRTGMLAFLINGLLGVQKEDLYRDFLFSNFGNIGGMRTQSIIDTYMDTVSLSGGSTLSEKIRSYLLSNGVDGTDIDNLVRIMTE